MNTNITADHPLHRGIEALRTWLDEHKTSANKFAIMNGIDPSILSKLMRGVTQRMSVDLANKINRGTCGKVPYSIWLTNGDGT